MDAELITDPSDSVESSRNQSQSQSPTEEPKEWHINGNIFDGTPPPEAFYQEHRHLAEQLERHRDERLAPWQARYEAEGKMGKWFFRHGYEGELLKKETDRYDKIKADYDEKLAQFTREHPDVPNEIVEKAHADALEVVAMTETYNHLIAQLGQEYGLRLPELSPTELLEERRHEYLTSRRVKADGRYEYTGGADLHFNVGLAEKEAIILALKDVFTPYTDVENSSDDKKWMQKERQPRDVLGLPLDKAKRATQKMGSDHVLGVVQQTEDKYGNEFLRLIFGQDQQAIKKQYFIPISKNTLELINSLEHKVIQEHGEGSFNYEWVENKAAILDDVFLYGRFNDQGRERLLTTFDLLQVDQMRAWYQRSKSKEGEYTSAHNRGHHSSHIHEKRYGASDEVSRYIEMVADDRCQKTLRLESKQDIKKVVDEVQELRNQAKEEGREMSDRQIYLHFRRQHETNPDINLEKTCKILFNFMGDDLDGVLPF